MTIIDHIRFIKKIGYTNVDELIMKRIENDKKTYISSFVEFNIYQALTYLIYQKINVKRKRGILQTIHPKTKRKNTNDLQIFTNDGGRLETNSILEPLYGANSTISRTYKIKTNNYNIVINNINPSKKYLLFLPTNNNVKNSNCEFIKCHQYLFFFVENKNQISIELINTLNTTISDSMLVWLDNFNNDYDSKFKLILTLPYSMVKNKYDVAKLIAVWQRTSLLTQILNEEEKMSKDYEHCNILGYSNMNDIKQINSGITNKENTFYFFTPNDTLGLKWQHIVEFTKLFNSKINYLLIQGSDDKILLDKLNKKLITDYQFNGQRQWYINDTINKKYYLMTLKYLIMRGALGFIGAGRIISKSEVIRFNHNLFNPQSFKGLDKQINTIAVKIQNKLVGVPICCSLKGKHGCLNSLPKYLKSGNNTYELVDSVYQG